MTYKQIETAREVRMWITRIVIPAVVGGVILMNDPVVRERAASFKSNMKNKFNSTFKKGKA